MDLRTNLVLQQFNRHHKIQKLLIPSCYFLIAFSIMVYIFYAISGSNTNKLALKYKDKAKSIKTEKIMINPHMNFRYNANEIYEIKAKQAFHKDNESAILQDVSVSGSIGNITAGKLQINEEGDHLVFTEQPVLILKKTNR